MKKNKSYILLHLLLMIFSLGPVCSKMAGKYQFLSRPFIFYYGLLIIILGVYAIGWQQVIKHMPISVAYANRAVTVAWGLVWGLLIFDEELSLIKIMGVSIIILGIILYARADNGREKKDVG